MYQHRVPDRRCQGYTVRGDADILRSWHMGRQVPLDRPHFELMCIAVVAEYLPVLLVHRLIGGYHTAFGAHPRAWRDAARLERKSGLVHFAQDVVHRIVDRARDRAVDGRGRGLVLPRARIGGHAAGRDRPMAQGPEKLLEPALANVLALDVGQRACDTFIGVVHAAVDRLVVLRTEPILLIPDIQRSFLERDGSDVTGDEFHDRIDSGSGCPFREIDHTTQDHPRHYI